VKLKIEKYYAWVFHNSPDIQIPDSF